MGKSNNLSTFSRNVIRANANNAATESKTEDKDAERCIKGIPIRSFIDEIKK